MKIENEACHGSKAIFLDRDGTIIEDRGYINSPSQVKFFDDTFPALRQVTGDYQLFIITNQQGIAEGILSQELVDQVNQHIVHVLKEEGVLIREVFVCPHTRDDACQCRKPHPYFLQKASQNYGLDLSSSFVIGDHPGDILCAANSGAQGIYVLTGHGEKHRLELPEHSLIVPGILEAVALIMGEKTGLSRLQTRLRNKK